MLLHAEHIPPQMFGAAFARENQLLKVQPKQGMYLACALLARGNVSVGDLNRGISRLLPTLQVAPWNPEPFKLGICASPPHGESSISQSPFVGNCVLKEQC